MSHGCADYHRRTIREKCRKASALALMQVLTFCQNYIYIKYYSLGEIPSSEEMCVQEMITMVISDENNGLCRSFYGTMDACKVKTNKSFISIFYFYIYCLLYIYI